MKYSDQALKGFTIVDTPFTDVDLFSLPDGIIALLPYRTVRCPRKRGKHTKFNVYNSASQAAYLIDGKVEFKYIERYIIVNKLVQTSARSFYFVNRPDFIANTSQFKTNLIKTISRSRILPTMNTLPRPSTTSLARLPNGIM